QAKEAANKLFAAKKYEEATEKYTTAISYNPNVAAYYANRAFAYIRSEFYGAAIQDAERAVALDP
ncbi:TPR repeat-domain-containing protein, partial [Phlyctochytrium arcticum]